MAQEVNILTKDTSPVGPKRASRKCAAATVRGQSSRKAQGSAKVLAVAFGSQQWTLVSSRRKTKSFFRKKQEAL